MAKVQLVDLKKSFGSAHVLHGLDLEVDEGEFVALVGPSGCGKSTLLRIIAGLDEPTSGEVRINGNWVNDLGPRERNIAMVFQSYALYPHMTVAQNIGFNLKISGVSKAEIEQRVSLVAGILDLGELMNRRPSQLSGGQRQRVAMGRAIVRKPDAFLFDEPLSNLDAKLRVQMRDEIKLLHKKVPTTSIYVTHDQIEAMTLADRIVIMNKGRIEQIGTPAELYSNPKSIFVAGFIGSPSMNFLPATLKQQGEKAVLLLEDGTQLWAGQSRPLPECGKVTIGVRPEHIMLGHGENQFTAQVELVEQTGAQNHLKIKLAGTLVTTVDNSLQPVASDALETFHVAPENIYVFA